MQRKLEILKREPLVHFSIVALVLFIVAELLIEENGTNYEETLLISEDILIEHLQFQKKTFDQNFARRYWEGLTQPEKSNLINDYIKEEVLYREALNLGLQKHDQIIRRRLIQKLDYVNGGFSSNTDISEEDLESYFQLHHEKYRIEASITFTHVFFDLRRHSKEKLEKTVKQSLNHLIKQSVPFEESALHGDRFIFHRNYVDRTLHLVASHFGDELAESIFQLPLNTWSGPFESPYGLHLILVSENKTSRLPSFREASPLVLEDYRRNKMEENKQLRIQELLTGYRIERDASIPYVPVDITYAH
ncbi:peptidyl-prolyl cis-trans isomerase [Microbulbifer sp. TRSA002]|uniref:peptidyl-prolyl cis-trans isomerase n=1 Tax=Microbulbifer sp. TRSA002 TaxID=3243382 RepID=UPI004039E60F